MSEVDIEKEADVDYPTSQVSRVGQRGDETRLPNESCGSGSSRTVPGTTSKEAHETHSPADLAGSSGEEFQDAQSTFYDMNHNDRVYNKQEDKRRESLQSVPQQKRKGPSGRNQDMNMSVNDGFSSGNDPNLKPGGAAGGPMTLDQGIRVEQDSAKLGDIVFRALEEYQQRQRLANDTLGTDTSRLITRRQELEKTIQQAETELKQLQDNREANGQPAPSFDAVETHDYATPVQPTPEHDEKQDGPADAGGPVSRDASPRASFDEQMYTNSASTKDASRGQITPPRAAAPRRHVTYGDTFVSPDIAESVVRSSPSLRSPRDNIGTHWSTIGAGEVLGASIRPSRRPTSPRVRTNPSQVPDFLERMRRVYGKSVMNTSRGHVSVHMAEVARVFLEHTQKRLLEAVFDFKYREDGEVEDEIVKAGDVPSVELTLLWREVEAWKNLEFMTETRKKKVFDPFVISADLTMQRAVLQEVQRKWSRRHLNSLSPESVDKFLKDMEPLTEKFGLDDPVDKKPVKRFGGETRSARAQQDWIQEYTEKVAMAVVGGAFLIAPMLVMVLHPGLVTSLVTTSACVFAFGLVMAIFLKAPFDVLSATAAYAAVMVVFIGTGGGP